MKKTTSIIIKKAILFLLIFINCFIFTACWNYKEVGDLWMVAGAAIDWDSKEEKFIVTAEIIKPKGGRETEMVAEVITFKSVTLFDAMRRAISISGRKLYWAHTYVLIISDTVARQGIMPILDLLTRGAEFRYNIWLAVSKENTAGKILASKPKLYDSVSFQLADVFKAQKSSSYFLNSEAWYFIKDYTGEGISPVLSAVKLYDNNGKQIPNLSGGAVFKKDKLVGYMDEIDAKSLLIVKNELKGGVLVLRDVANTKVNVTLEVIGSKTTVTPEITDGFITMNINITMDTALPELGGAVNFIDEEGRNMLKRAAKKTIEDQVKLLVDRAQNDFQSDILGYGRIIRKKKPKEWRKLKPDWEEKFSSIRTNITTDVRIINSFGSYHPIIVGD